MSKNRDGSDPMSLDEQNQQGHEENVPMDAQPVGSASDAQYEPWYGPSPAEQWYAEYLSLWHHYNVLLHHHNALLYSHHTLWHDYQALCSQQYEDWQPAESVSYAEEQADDECWPNIEPSEPDDQLGSEDEGGATSFSNADLPWSVNSAFSNLFLDSGSPI